MSDIQKIAVEVLEGGGRLITVVLRLNRGEELDEGDVSKMMQTIEEANGSLTEGLEEPEPDKPKRRRRSKKDEEPEEEKEEAPKKTRRRRSKKDEEREEVEEAPKKTRRRRSKKDEEPEEEEEEEAPKRRRRKKAEPKGPTKEDVAKSVSEAASKLTPEIAAEIVLEFSDTGKVEDVPEDKRQELIDAVNFELEEE